MPSRNIEFSDMFSISLKPPRSVSKVHQIALGEIEDVEREEILIQHVHQPTAVMLISDDGKTNKHDKREFTGFLRAKNVLLCAHSHLALHLFYRFMVPDEVEDAVEAIDWTSFSNW